MFNLKLLIISWSKWTVKWVSLVGDLQVTVINLKMNFQWSESLMRRWMDLGVSQLKEDHCFLQLVWIKQCVFVLSQCICQTKLKWAHWVRIIGKPFVYILQSIRAHYRITWAQSQSHSTIGQQDGPSRRQPRGNVIWRLRFSGRWHRVPTAQSPSFSSSFIFFPSPSPLTRLRLIALAVVLWSVFYFVGHQLDFTLTGVMLYHVMERTTHVEHSRSWRLREYKWNQGDSA